MPSSFNSFWKLIINVIYIARPWSFLMTIASVTIGVTYVYYEFNIFNLAIYLITLIGAISLHAYTNVINDYFDTLYGVDKPGAPTTRYRPHPIISGIFKPHHILRISIAYLFIAALTGLSLYFLGRPLILFLGLIGALISLEYTGPPLKYKYKGLGELAVFIVWGPLMFLGSNYAQTGLILFKPVLISFPIGLLVAAVLLIDEIRDYEYDKFSNIKTLPIIIGQQNALKLYYILTTLPFILVTSFVIINILKVSSLIIFLTLPKLIDLIKHFSKQIPDVAAPQTSKFTLFFATFYTIGIILSKIFI
ncbi:MAG: prenyltransferase [Thermoprotei archaeon]